MKNYLIPFFFLALFMVSCGDDDDGANISLEGTLWAETSFSTTNCDDPLDNETSTSDCSATECYTIRLSGGTITLVDKEDGIEYTETGSYTIIGNIITVELDGETLAVTFAIVGNQLTLSFDDPFSNCTTSIVYTASS